MLLLLGDIDDKGGSSIFRLVYGEQAKFFERETVPKLKHTNRLTVSMVNDGKSEAARQSTNQNLLFRSRDWLSANQGPVFPAPVGSCILHDGVEHCKDSVDSEGHN